MDEELFEILGGGLYELLDNLGVDEHDRDLLRIFFKHGGSVEALSWMNDNLVSVSLAYDEETSSFNIQLKEELDE